MTGCEIGVVATAAAVTATLGSMVSGECWFMSVAVDLIVSWLSCLVYLL